MSHPPDKQSAQLIGWLFSVYADKDDGAVLWLITVDGIRHRLCMPYKTAFYLAAREFSDLHSVYTQLMSWSNSPQMIYCFKRDLFKGLRMVLQIQAPNPITQERIFYTLQKRAKGIQFYNAKIPFSVRFGGETGCFPMAKCRLVLDDGGLVESIDVLDSPWDLSYDLPLLRQLVIEPDIDPTYAPPSRISLQGRDKTWEIATNNQREFLLAFIDILESYDPDVILAAHGDAWLFPTLRRIAEKLEIDFNPNRDKNKEPMIKDELTYHSYGQVHYRAAQTLLFGRWHIDPGNAAMTGGFSLHAAIEMARVSGVDVQVTARNSPGAGFTAMQIRQALRWDALVPLKKRQTEPFRPLMALNDSDGGGLVYHPIVGLHKDVAELDFFSMYPSIMSTWNISGETAGDVGIHVRDTPRSGMPINQDVPGLVATILKPLLDKRRLAKAMIKAMKSDDSRRELLQGSIDGLKWLGYVSFGYQGHAHNLYGRILAHEAICAIGREMLVRAIEASQDYGFDVLAANTDSVFVHKEGISHPEDFQPLIDEINQRTGLIIELEGIFQWLAFLPSKMNPRIGASNRYFGKFYNGGLKVRGMAQRRADTPQWITNTEREIMATLARVPRTEYLQEHIPDALAIIYQAVADLYADQVPLDDLVTRKRLTREPEEYKGKSDSAKAANQLRSAGINVRVGQRIPMLYVKGEKPGVYAWGLPEEPKWNQIDKARYRDLLIRSIYQVLQPLGLSEADLTSLVIGGGRQLELWPKESEREELDEASLADDLFGPFLIIR
jgi:DNA polymerase II